MSQKRGPVTLYGLYGFTHGGARVLTIMSPDGATAALSAVEAGVDVIVYSGTGQLTRYQEKRSGALRRLVRQNAVEVLSKEDWDGKKNELGDAVFR